MGSREARRGKQLHVRLCITLRARVLPRTAHVVSAALAGAGGRLRAFDGGDRDIVRGSLDTVSEWRLTRPADVPGQAIGQADYVLIAEIVEVDRFEQQASEHVQQLSDDLAQLVSSRGMLVVRPVL